MKKVLITGGNRGIGLASTKKFLEKGYYVVVVGRNKGTFVPSPNSEFIEFDLMNHKEIPALVEKVGPIDVLVNNAGVLHDFKYDEYPEDKLAEIFGVNLRAPYALITEFSKKNLKRGGRIVNVGSIAGHTGSSLVWYAVSKAGLMNMTKSFSKILGPKGITVNAVAPGIVNTDMKNSIPEDRQKMIKDGTNLGRFCEAEEVAEAIFWLGSASPEYINGSAIDINDGVYLR